MLQAAALKNGVTIPNHLLESVCPVPRVLKVWTADETMKQIQKKTKA